jgi:hypothetical protein
MGQSDRAHRFLPIVLLIALTTGCVGGQPKAYHYLPRGVTLTVNPGDSVLRNAQRYHRVSRAGSHSFWYTHPWINSDVLVQFMFNAAPEQRGLVENFNEGGPRYWTFPPDYPERIIRILKEARGSEGE